MDAEKDAIWQLDSFEVNAKAFCCFLQCKRLSRMETIYK